jgi:hypothetical protein
MCIKSCIQQNVSKKINDSIKWHKTCHEVLDPKFQASNQSTHKHLEASKESRIMLHYQIKDNCLWKEKKLVSILYKNISQSIDNKKNSTNHDSSCISTHYHNFSFCECLVRNQNGFMNHIESIFVFYKMDHCNFRKPLCA